MVQAVRNFEEGLRKSLGIVVECRCGKRATFQCADFYGYIAPDADIEALVWRCTWCRERARYVRYLVLTGISREGLAQWTPPAGRKRKWP